MRTTNFYRFGGAIFFIVAFCLFITPQEAFAGTCTIFSNVTQTQADLEGCAGGALDNLIVNTGVTLTLSEPITVVSDVTINGTGKIDHVAEDVDGVNITAGGDMLITGSVNADGKGCSGGVDATAYHGRGPDPAASYACATAKGGYGQGDHSAGSGGGYGGNGGDGSYRSETYGTTYGNPLAPIYLGSGGGGEYGGDGGGLVRLDVGGTLTVNGSISADGGTTFAGWDGGGSGGAIYLQTNILDGSGVITAKGGNGHDSGWDGGGGGAGRVAVYYNTNSGFTLTNITAVKGTTGTGAEAGEPGSTFILNRKTDDGAGDVRITTGIDFRDGDDYSRTNITIDSGAKLTCPETISTLDFTATGNITDNGSTWVCAGAISTLNFSAVGTITTAGVSWDFSNTSQFNLSTATWTNSGDTITIDKSGAEVDWDITNDLTLTNMTYTGGNGGTSSSSGGVLDLDNVINVALVNSDINSSVDWQGLTTLNVDASSTINASSKGCSGGSVSRGDGYGPNSGDSYKCALSQASAGQGGHDAGSGGGYGGNGGDGSYRSDTFGTTYVYEATPIYLGSGGSAANTGAGGGNGGGLVRIDVSGTITINGDITSNGQTPSSGQGGGGSGGSVYITTSTLAGSANISVTGGTGGDGAWDGGGGGGGRAAVYYAALSGYNLSNVTAGGGATPGGSEAGDDGTVYTVQLLVLDYGKYKDVNTDGKVDQVDLVFNKSLTLDECESADYSFGGADAGSIAVSSCNVGGSILELTIGSAPAGDTNLALTLSYDASNGTANSIHDGAGYNLGDISSETLVDAAAPVIITLSPANGSDNVSTTSDLEITFTENVVVGTGDIDIKLSSDDSELEAIDITSGQVAGSGTDTLTINPSEEFDGGVEYYVLIDATALDDANSVDFAGIASKAAWVFEVANTAGYETDEPVARVILLSPNGGEVLVVGAVETISWTLSNYSSDVELYFSSDAGASYDLVDTVTGESYDWTIPSAQTSSAFVKVSLPDAASEAFDSSDYTFSIAAAESSSGGGGTGDTAEEEVSEPEAEEETEEESDLFDLPTESESPHTGLMQGVAQGLMPGDMITGETTKVVYYLDENGKRRPFPSLQIFLTWADSFDNVRLVSDATLSLIPLGAPMLPKPGLVLVKIPTVPHVYVVEMSEDADRAVIRHIPDEETAIELFGEDWADYVIDVDLSLFGRFIVGEKLSGDEEIDLEVMKHRVELVLD